VSFKQVLFYSLIVPLFWAAWKWGMNRLFGEAAARRALRAYQRGGYRVLRSPENLDEHKKTLHALREKQAVNVRWINVIPLGTNANLDTVELSPQSSAPITQQAGVDQPSPYHIIRFLGDKTRYEEHLKEAVQEVREHGCYVTLFDYRGVGLSTGKLRSQWDLVKDGVAQVKRLIDSGVSPDKIVLDGHDIGGAVAVLVAHHLFNRGYSVKVFNDRSFSSRTKLIVANIRGLGYADGYSSSSFGRTLGWIAYPFVKFILVSVKWDMNAAKAFQALPSDKREEMLVRSNRWKRKSTYHSRIEPRPVDDTDVPNWAAMHTASGLRNARIEAKQGYASSSYQKPTNSTDRQQVEKKIHEDTKRRFSDYHKASGVVGGHNASRASLIMRCPPPEAQPSTERAVGEQSGYTAQQFFWHFVERDGNSNNHATGQSSDNRGQVAPPLLKSAAGGSG
jgi:pimeloyl-ACP methyl ester carboxylesterase